MMQHVSGRYLSVREVRCARKESSTKHSFTYKMLLYMSIPSMRCGSLSNTCQRRRAPQSMPAHKSSEAKGGTITQRGPASQQACPVNQPVGDGGPSEGVKLNHT